MLYYDHDREPPQNPIQSVSRSRQTTRVFARLSGSVVEGSSGLFLVILCRVQGLWDERSIFFSEPSIARGFDAWCQPSKEGFGVQATRERLFSFQVTDSVGQV